MIQQKVARKFTASTTPKLRSKEALELAATMDIWPGSFARVLMMDVDSGKLVKLPGGYKPWEPPPSQCFM